MPKETLIQQRTAEPLTHNLFATRKTIMKTILFILLFSVPSFAEITIWENVPVHLPANVREWLHLEVKVNTGASSERTDQPIRLEHVEIPMALLKDSFGLGLRQEILDSLVIEINGEKFVRWIFNPEDTKYKAEVLKELEKLTGKAPETKSHYIGYLTASRSLVIQDSVTGAIFSLKTSTNKTGGNWNDKKMTGVAAAISREYSDLIQRNQGIDHNKHFVALPEPLAFTFAEADQAFTVRDYPIFSNSQLRIIPFFAALHPNFGKEFAEKKGVDPTTYWTDHLTTTWGRAMAEGLAHYGFYPNSAHSQDFTMEFNEQREPTGRIYVRDIMDSDGERMILEARKASEVLDIYKTTTKITAWTGKVYMKAIPFNGTNPPEWLNIEKFMHGFYVGFTQRYSHLTKVTGFEKPRDSSWFILEKHVGENVAFKQWVERLRTHSRIECRKIRRGPEVTQ